MVKGSFFIYDRPDMIDGKPAELADVYFGEWGDTTENPPPMSS
jgi:hypothetical protein